VIERLPVDGATVIVTGAAGAIGSAVVNAFVERGYEVIGIDLQPSSIEPIASYRHVLVDVRDPQAMAATAASLGPDTKVRHVVGVAGGAIPEEVCIAEIDRLDVELFRRSLDLNLVSQYVALRAFLSSLRASAEQAAMRSRPDRSITLISSVNAIVGMDMPAYSAAKAGLLGMVRVLARLLGPEGIRVNAVAPGTVPTPRTQRVWAQDSEHFERLTRQAPLGRLPTCSEVASAVLTLAVELTAVTGQTLVVDAGQTATWTY
jgi:NAD(P)-dependent dehydrogenase (short-subunit alcohol dehydrogenase family)